MDTYVHGYSDKETIRLTDQANTLKELLHGDTHYLPGSKVLEAGCGTGAQTVILSLGSPEAEITAMDISSESLEKAKNLVSNAGIGNVEFKKADIFDLPFEENVFDHVFVCFVLEHLNNPMEALKHLRGVLKPEGTITVIEGDHGSYYSYPQTKEATHAVQCLIDIQERLGGNSLIGRQVFPLLKQAGFQHIQVSPRMVYVDSSKPGWVDGFSKKTFIAMVEGVKEQAIELDLIDEKAWNKGISDLYSATDELGTFCYTFFKGIGIKR